MAFATPGPNYPQRKIDFGVITDSFNTLIAHWQAYLTAGVVMIGSSLPAVFLGLVPMPSEFGFEGFDFDFAFLFTAEVFLFLPTLIVVPLVCFGVTKFTLNVTRGNQPDPKHIWEGFRNPLGYLWTAILSGLVTFLGIFLCCFGAYVTGGLMMFTYPLKVETNSSGSEVVSSSWEMLKGDWFMAAVFYLVVGMIAGLGSTFIAIGAVFTLPYMYIAQVHLYNRYTGHYIPPQPQQPQQPHSPYPRPGQPGSAQHYPPPNQPRPGAAPQNPPKPGDQASGSDPLRPDRP